MYTNIYVDYSSSIHILYYEKCPRVDCKGYSWLGSMTEVNKVISTLVDLCTHWHD